MIIFYVLSSLSLPLMIMCLNLSLRINKFEEKYTKILSLINDDERLLKLTEFKEEEKKQLVRENQVSKDIPFTKSQLDLIRKVALERIKKYDFSQSIDTWSTFKETSFNYTVFGININNESVYMLLKNKSFLKIIEGKNPKLSIYSGFDNEQIKCIVLIDHLELEELLKQVE